MPVRDGFLLTNLDNIIHCHSDGNYSTVYLNNSNAVTITRKLKELEEALPSRFFIRVHHSHIVNLKHVKKYLKQCGGQLLLSNCQVVDVSRRKRQALLDRLIIL